MAFEVGATKAAVRPSINVTPLVDVVLVLLIIFMVVTPLMVKQFFVHVPKKDESAQPAPADAKPPVVLSVRTDGRLFLNQDEIKEAELEERLKRVFAARGEHTLFFDADEDVPYGTAARIMDRARGGRAMTVAVLTDQIPR